jgi:transcriptional regulator GlxA family with amidase domain
MRVAIYAFDGISMFHLAAPQLVFSEVNRLPGQSEWAVTIWAPRKRTVTTAEGYRIGGLAGPDAARSADMVIVPSWPEDLPLIDAQLQQILTHAHRRGAIIVGLCLGAVAVADSGLLSGRDAVTHWEAMPAMRNRHADVSWDAQVLYIDHGDVLTSAGTASAIDACLHLVRLRLGASGANRVARRLVVAPHRDGGQAQYVERPSPMVPETAAIGETIDWILAHLDSEHTVDTMADKAKMSRRSFVRHFRAATGSTPARWLQQQRLDQARLLLETTDLDIDRVASACGFCSVVTFRQNFSGAFATSPSSYRRQFRQGCGRRAQGINGL